MKKRNEEQQELFQLLTKNGYNFDEVASALQKEIRRGNEENAMYWALELHESNYNGYLFRRLPVIAAEDIGLASPETVSQVCQVCQYGLYMFDNKKRIDTALLGFLILLMCRAKKNREGDEFVNIMQDRRRRSNYLDMPDYAVDMHTKRGKQMGRGENFFWEEGAKINNSIPNKKWNYEK